MDSIIRSDLADNLSHYRFMADILDNLHIGLCLFDTDDRTLLWNQTFLRLFPEHVGHVRTGEHYAANLRRFYAGRLSPAELVNIEQCVADGIRRHQTQTVPFIFEHRGQWVRVASEPVPNIGRIRIWTPVAPPDGAAAPPPERAQAEPRDLMPFAADDGDGASLTDPAGRITWVNPRFVRLLRLADPAEAIGRTHADVFDLVWSREPGGEGGVAAQCRQTLVEAERFAGAPFEMPLPGGEWLRILQRRRPDNTIVSSLADISAMKRLQQGLSEAREAAEQANRAKDDFLATISHELRTPMNGVLGMLDVLADGGLTSSQAEQLDLARQSAEALLGLLDGILTFSRLDAGHVAMDRSAADPAGLIASVAGLMRTRANEKGLTLRWDMAPGMPAAILCDPARLRQVLLNLIGNAVKFTERGEIVISARCGDFSADGRSTLDVSVADTGIGIPAAAIRTIFAPFVQADTGISRRFGGTGLGLAICRRLLTVMGGEISVTSSEGQGSCFRFSVPCEVAEPAFGALGPGRDGQAVTLPALRVLVADDNAINREVARLHLERLGLTVLTVGGGPEAIEACREAFDLILVDLQMPGMDGYETTRAIRGSGLPSAGAAIVAMTAHAGPDHRRRCQESGMQGVITKPLRGASLPAEIAAAIASRPGLVDFAGTTNEAAPMAALLDAERVAFWTGLMPQARRASMIEEFEAHARDTLARIASAFATGEPHDALAHELKGAAWNLGARYVGDMAGVFERLPASVARARFPELEIVLGKTLAELRLAARG